MHDPQMDKGQPMSIAAFIQGEMQKRLERAGCLVVYDAERRYHALCLALASATVRVVDASDSGIVSREAATLALCELGNPRSALKGLLIYVPAVRPQTDEQRQADPFSVYAACGAVFPQDDGDEYLSLCLRAKPDHATEIRRLFANHPQGPTFAAIDAIGGGLRWPQLRAALRVESASELLTALLAPTASQAEALKAQDGWMPEAREFLRATLGLEVKTRGQTWSALA
ncbi:MAG: PglZ domain-containing protein, partial [Anaerolineae bacterium]|nr:PglZ domain-containing protein [Anaerolineae bacterium]